MKAILIARVSTEEQKEAGYSLPAQVARLERYCQSKGFEIMQICSFDESAYCNQRTEFDRIIDLIIDQKEKIIVCCDKVDRLSRNIFDKRISILYEKALSDQIELHFISDGQIINSQISAVEKFQFGISLGLAKYYSDAVSDNVKRAIEQKLRKGEWPARAPMGYKNIDIDGDKVDIVVDETDAAIIRKAFELYATGAFSMELLCKKFKAEYNIDWRVCYIDKVLKNHFYYGIMVIKGKQYPHRYPPIITKTLFDQVQAVKKRFNKKTHRYAYAGRPFMYRGLLRCAHCGFAITPEKHKGYIYYHCTEFAGKHGAKWLREEKITEQIGDVFKRMQIPPEILGSITDTLRELHESKIDFHNKIHQELSDEQKKLTKMIDNLYLDKLSGRITERDYDRFYASLRDQVSQINGKLDQLQGADDSYFITTKYVLELTKRAYDLFISSEVEEKRQLIKLVFSNLQVEDGNVVYDVQKPFDMIIKCSDDLLWRPQGDLNSCFRRERAVS